tara:strand:+ start:3300 stop:3806 length:507 start_codon:yes stop_codon:yes gene_type:complete
MKASLIVAVSRNGVIGKNNNLIWHLPKDMIFFKEMTIGHHVIMGRKNFESIPHKYSPLPNRINIVISRQSNYIADGCIIVNSIEEALLITKNSNDKEPFIIGGGEIYKIALEKNLINKIYLTRIMHDFEGDTFFPELGPEWQEINRICNKKDSEHKYNYDFITFKKKY